MARSNHARKFGRTELLSDRRGSADVEPFRSLFRTYPAPSSTRPCKGSLAPPGDEPGVGPFPFTTRGGGRLYPRPRRQAGPVWSGGVLDRGRHGAHARHVVAPHPHLFPISPPRPHPPN